MSVEQAYEGAFDLWVKAQKNQIKQTELNIENSKKMIEIHKEALEIHTGQLEWEKTLLEEAVKNKET